MILCTVDDDNFKLFAIFLWETPFWYCSTIFRRSIGGIGDPLPILTSERHCHSERLFLYPIMLPIDLISCKLVLQLFLICTFNFSGLLLLPVPTFLECVALMKSKWANIWHDISKCLTFNIWYVIYILLWIKYKFMRFVNYCIPFLFTICTVSQLFGIGFVYTLHIIYIYIYIHTLHIIYIYIYIWRVHLQLFKSFSLCIPINLNQTGVGLFD